MVGLLHGAHAMMDGAKKYGPYNWRDKKVQADIYVDAALRHLMDWFEGQECASDSHVHHLGHALACCAILLDAQANDSLIDNRPLKRGKNGQPIRPNWLPETMERLRGYLKQ
jgi:broad-specificity NMP kinase